MNQNKSHRAALLGQSFLAKFPSFMAGLVLLLTMFLTGTQAHAQPTGPIVSTYRVRATSGSLPYFPEVGRQAFEYSVGYSCESCYIEVGGVTFPGQVGGSPFGPECTAIIPFPNGESIRLVSTTGGHLQAFDGRSGALMVNFSASALLPPKDASLRELEEYLQFCFESGIYPALF